MAGAYTDESVEVAETKLHLLRGGTGEPLLILHGAGGNRGWLRHVQALSERFQVFLPDHPGFGTSDRPEWIASVPDLACFYLWALEDLGLSRVRVLGFSLGGWLAAEMAVMCPQLFERLVLVGAAGVKPTQGEITDIFLLSPQDMTEKMFYDPRQAPEYEQIYGRQPTPDEQDLLNRNREMSARIAWKPYMHDPRLPSSSSGGARMLSCRSIAVRYITSISGVRASSSSTSVATPRRSKNRRSFSTSSRSFYRREGRVEIVLSGEG
jgi:pimeloyl-ACP methyl ester carboxylesterase